VLEAVKFPAGVTDLDTGLWEKEKTKKKKECNGKCRNEKEKESESEERGGKGGEVYLSNVNRDDFAHVVGRKRSSLLKKPL
jgi:hypothetical protein